MSIEPCTVSFEYKGFDNLKPVLVLYMFVGMVFLNNFSK